MAVKDVRLGRLAATRAEALRFRNEAWHAQRAAWLAYSQARDELSRFNKRLQQADDLQDELWHSYRRERRDNRSLIKRLGHRQKEVGKASVRCFKLANMSLRATDTAQTCMFDEPESAARDYQKARMLLVGQSSVAKRQVQEAVRRLKAVKSERDQIRSISDDLLVDYFRLQAEFQEAKSAYKVANRAFKLRLRELRDSGQDAESAVEVARRAGIPQKYLDNVFVKRAVVSSRYDIYFGGLGHPVGPGHGHYCLIGNRVVYRRDPVVVDQPAQPLPP